MLLATMEVDTHLHITEGIHPATTMAMHRFTRGTVIAGLFDPLTLIMEAPAIMEAPVTMVDGIIGRIAAGNGSGITNPATAT